MSSLLGVLAGLAAAAIWGGMYVVSKVVLDVVPPFSLLSVRLLLGIIVLGAIWLVRPKSRGGGSPRLISAGLGVGALGFGLSLGLQFIGTKLSNASNAALVTSASPAFMVGFAIWLLGERITPRRLAALVLATLGVVVVIDPTTARLDGSAFWGNLALLGAALTWGLFSVLVKWTSHRLSVLSLSLLGFLGGPVPVGAGRCPGASDRFYRRIEPDNMAGDSVPGSRLDRPGDVLVERSLGHAGRQRCFSAVLCPAGCGRRLGLYAAG